MLRSALLLSAVAGALLGTAAHAQVTVVAPELWDRPRTSRSVLGHESIRGPVVAALQQPDAQIVLHHAPGAESQLQAEELRSWLGALAIDPRRIVLRSDGTAGAPMTIEIVP